MINQPAQTSPPVPTAPPDTAHTPWWQSSLFLLTLIGLATVGFLLVGFRSWFIFGTTSYHRFLHPDSIVFDGSRIKLGPFFNQHAQTSWDNFESYPPDAIWSYPDNAFAATPNLRELRIEHQYITQIPSSVFSLQQLLELRLPGNQVQKLPASISQLSQLQVLDLSRNQLQAVPAELGQLRQLEILYLSHNQLSTLPVSIGQLTNLRVLDLRNNKLSSLPPTMTRLSNLDALYLGGNPLLIEEVITLQQQLPNTQIHFQ